MEAKKQPQRNNRRETMLYFIEQAIPDQIERTIFELNKNLRYYLQRHPDPRIHYYTFNHSDYLTQLEKVRLLMNNIR